MSIAPAKGPPERVPLEGRYARLVPLTFGGAFLRRAAGVAGDGGATAGFAVFAVDAFVFAAAALAIVGGA